MSEPRVTVRMRRWNMAGIRAGAVVTPLKSEAEMYIANGWADPVVPEPKPEKAAVQVKGE